MKADCLAVILYGDIVGHLYCSRTQKVTFEYTSDYMKQANSPPISLSMTTVSKSHGGNILANWLIGLLPDVSNAGDGRGMVKTISVASEFGLLTSERGLDCAGAIQFSPIDETESVLKRKGWSEKMSEDKICEWLTVENKKRTSGVVPSIVFNKAPVATYSISGMQAKIALRQEISGWHLPHAALPTTHIIKPDIPNFKNQATIEHICMAVADNIGLRAAKTHIERFGDIDAIVVERFDRMDDPTGLPKSKRIHMEDMCQALGVSPKNKYQWCGGPAMEEVTQKLSEKARDPNKEIMKFMDLVIYNFVIHNNDAHIKNYSTYLLGPYTELTPLYDSCSVFPYYESNPVGLPMLIQSTRKSLFNYHHNQIPSFFYSDTAENTEAWMQCAQRVGISGKALVSRVAEIASDIPNAMVLEVEKLPDRLAGTEEVQKLVVLLTERCQRLSAIFQSQ